MSGWPRCSLWKAAAAPASVVRGNNVTALLNDVCDLHVLSLLERERGWFLEHGRLTPPRAKAVTAAVNDLCKRLRPRARLLVDAFGIPDAVLAAPIALNPSGSVQPHAVL